MTFFRARERKLAGKIQLQVPFSECVSGIEVKPTERLRKTFENSRDDEGEILERPTKSIGNFLECKKVSKKGYELLKRYGSQKSMVD